MSEAACGFHHHGGLQN